jgi:hypothetical protein
VQGDCSVDHGGVVGRHAREELAIAQDRVRKPAVRKARFDNETICGAGCVEPVGAFQAARGLGQGRDRQTIPVDQDFVVAAGADTAFAMIHEEVEG